MYCYNTVKCIATIREEDAMREEFEGTELCEYDEREVFDNDYITTKAELLEALGRYVKKAKSDEGLDIFQERSEGFKKAYLKILNEFYEAVLKTKLFEELEPWWFYSFSIDEKGASLHLQYAEYVSVDQKEGYIDSMFIGEDFELVTKEAKMLSVEQYAENYGVSVGTVRQWIRRAKIRGAVKTGTGWRISELCAVRKRKYSPGRYYFAEGSVISEEYPFLNQCGQVSIRQDVERAELFHITYYGENEEDYGELQMNRQEREKFELFLNSHPEVQTEMGTTVFIDAAINGEVY